MSEDSPPPGEAWMPFLIRKGRFAECILLGWQSVEDKVDQMVVQEFELDFTPTGQDSRVDLLREVTFRKKVELLKAISRLSDRDTATIHKFADERNKLFHGDVFALQNPAALLQKEKTPLMELARAAAQITQNRGFGVWFDEGTNDLGNKNIPKPDKHPAKKRMDELRQMFASVSKLDG